MNYCVTVLTRLQNKIDGPLSRGKAVCTTDTIRRSWAVQIGEGAEDEAEKLTKLSILPLSIPLLEASPVNELQ